MVDFLRPTRTSQPQGPVEIGAIARGIVWVGWGGSSPAQWNLGQASRLVPTNNPTIQATTDGIGLKSTATNSSWRAASEAGLNEIGIGDCSVFVRFTPSSTSALTLMMGRYNGGGNWWLGHNASAQIQASFLGASLTAGTVAVGKTYTVFAVRRSGVVYLYLNGVLLTSGAGAANWNTTSGLALTNFGFTAGFQYAGTVSIGGVYNRALSDAEIKTISDNPWQIFKPVSRSRWIPAEVSAGGDTQDLAAAATAQATATADLLKGVSLAGAALGVASASGAMSLSVPLAATATATASSTGQIALTVNLAAGALAQATAGATLSLAVNLSAAAVAQATASAAFGGAAALAADAIANAQASAALQVGKPLAASAQAQAASGATLWLEVPLSAAALAQASSSGALSLTITLAASALSQATASASLPGVVSLAANGVAVATAGATLLVSSLNRMFPLAGVPRVFPLTASQSYPLAGVTQAYPL